MIKVSGYKLNSTSFTNNSQKPETTQKTKRPLSMEEKIGLTSALVILGSIGLYYATRKSGALKKNVQAVEETLEKSTNKTETPKAKPVETEAIKPVELPKSEELKPVDPPKIETVKPLKEVKNSDIIEEDIIIKNADDGENIVFANENETTDFIDEALLIKNADEVENTDFAKVPKPEEVIDVLDPGSFLSSYDPDLKSYSRIIEEDNIVLGEEAVTPKKGGFSKFIDKLTFWKKK